MKTTEEIRNTKSENKTAEYMELTRECVKRANQLAKENKDSHFMKMASLEVIGYWRKVERADCEYSAYTYAHSAEKWIERMELGFSC